MNTALPILFFSFTVLLQMSKRFHFTLHPYHINRIDVVFKNYQFYLYSFVPLI
ncbi:Uncharacterised protein [Vibrio cholerae]|nr:Uncharacterised protein [Vibrio cholerae]